MANVPMVEHGEAPPEVRAVFDDIKATKKISWIPGIWRALATHPEHLELCWTRLKAIMRPGKVDLLTKEIIALAVSVTNSATAVLYGDQVLEMSNSGPLVHALPAPGPVISPFFGDRLWHGVFLLLTGPPC